MSDSISIVKDQFLGAWNAHSAEQVLQLFEEEAMANIDPPFPGAPPTFKGKPELQGFVQAFISGIHINAWNFRSSGNEVLFDATVGADAIRQLGVEGVDQSDVVVMQGNKIKSFSIKISPESNAKLTAGAAKLARA